LTRHLVRSFADSPPSAPASFFLRFTSLFPLRPTHSALIYFLNQTNPINQVHDPTGALEHLASNRRGKVEAARARRAKSAAAKLQQSNGTGGGADDTTSASVAPASETTTPSSTSSRDSAAHVDTSDLDDLMLEEENASVGDFHVNWEVRRGQIRSIIEHFFLDCFKGRIGSFSALLN